MTEPDQPVGGEALSAIDLLLARILLKEADAELVTELQRPEIAEVLEALEPGVGAHLDTLAEDPAALEALACEYASLFLLPGGISPFAATWLGGEEGQVRAQLANEVTTLHQVLRVQPIDFGMGQVPDDHIGMLLALLGLVLRTEPGQAQGGLALRALGLVEPWGTSFAEALGERAESPLYRATANLLLETLREHARAG